VEHTALRALQALNQKLLREVTLLARLHHEYVVRYYNAWLENADEEDMRPREDVRKPLSPSLSISAKVPAVIV
jgi:serine/threonine protein kinase